MADFGANEWLVDEMYERYQADPKSVDDSWGEFFKTRASGNGASIDTRPATPATPSKPDAEAKTATKAETKATVEARKAEAKPVAKQEPKPEAKQEPKQEPKPEPKGPGPVPKEKAPPAPAEASDEPTLVKLRGAGMLTAKNMDLSLSVPTATSVRTVPVKLLWDNRIVINNHLARARGGKVSSPTSSATPWSRR